MPFSFSQLISAVSLRILMVLLKNSSFVFCRRFGIAPSQTKKICVEVEA
jgi:hypothetical protein